MRGGGEEVGGEGLSEEGEGQVAKALNAPGHSGKLLMGLGKGVM